MMWLLIALVAGAFASSGTLLHSFAVAFDMLAQGLFWNSPIGVTISSRAGLSARKGNDRFARLICWVFRDPQHCEQAIAADIARANQALALLSSTFDDVKSHG